MSQSRKCNSKDFLRGRIADDDKKPTARLAEEEKTKYFLTSAKTGENVEELMTWISLSISLCVFLFLEGTKAERKYKQNQN